MSGNLVHRLLCYRVAHFTYEMYIYLIVTHYVVLHLSCITSYNLFIISVPSVFQTIDDTNDFPLLVPRCLYISTMLTLGQTVSKSRWSRSYSMYDLCNIAAFWPIICVCLSLYRTFHEWGGRRENILLPPVDTVALALMLVACIKRDNV